MEAFYAIMIIASGNNSDPITGEANSMFSSAANSQQTYNKNASQAVCKSFGAHVALPVLTDQSRYLTLIEMARNGSCAPTLFPLRFYIGLHRNSSGTWIWDDGQIYEHQPSFMNWDENDEVHKEPEPDGISRSFTIYPYSDSYFAMVVLDAKGKTTWMDVREITVANSVLCQTTDYVAYRKLMDPKRSADHPCSAWNDGKEIKAGNGDSQEETGWSAMKLAAVVIPSTAAAVAAIGLGAAVIKKAMKPPPSPPDISPQDAKDAVDNAKDMMDDVSDLTKTILDRIIILRTLESLAKDDGSSHANSNQWFDNETESKKKSPMQPKKIQKHRQPENQRPVGICSASDLIATFTATDDGSGEKPMRVECNLSILSQWISEGDRAEISAYEKAVRKALPLKIKVILIRGVIKSAKAPGSD